MGNAQREEFPTSCKLYSEKYKVPTVGLEGYIYELKKAKHPVQFINTTEKLCNDMQTKYKSGADVAGALRQF